MTLDDLTLDTTQSIDIKADIGDVFRSVLHRFGEGFTNPQGEPMQAILGQWPGGRPLAQWPRLAAGHSDALR